jgi:hypothetical protein
MLLGDCTLTLLGGWFITPPPVTIYAFCKQTVVVTFWTYESELMLLGHFRKWSLLKLLILLSKEGAENLLWSVWLPSSSINLPQFRRTPLLVPFLCQINSVELDLRFSFQWLCGMWCSVIRHFRWFCCLYLQGSLFLENIGISSNCSTWYHFPNYNDVVLCKLVSRLIVISHLMILGFTVWVQCVFRMLGVVLAYVRGVEPGSSICSPWLLRILVLCLTLHWHWDLISNCCPE